MAFGSHTKHALKRLALSTDENVDLSWLNIRKLPPLSPTLKSLNCSYTNLEEISELPQNLISLNCSYTKIKFLPTLPQTLKNLNCVNCRNLEIQQGPDESIAEYEARWLILRNEKAVNLNS
jgi:hypothetical protein